MPDLTRFPNRAEAGERLASRLRTVCHGDDIIVVALPRGGIPVALAIAQALGAPLDFLQVRKLGVPGRAELAMGAIAADGTCTLAGERIAAFGVSQQAVAAVAERELHTIERRERRYRAVCPALSLHARVVILVDDGMATGATMRAAVRIVRRQHPARVIAAVPVASRDACNALRADVDELVCSLVPAPFRAVGYWYERFEQVDDDDVIAMLAAARRPGG